MHSNAQIVQLYGHSNYLALALGKVSKYLDMQTSLTNIIRGRLTNAKCLCIP